MKTVFVKEIGKKKILGKYWGEKCIKHSVHYSDDLIIQSGGDEVVFDNNNDKNRLNEVIEICKYCGIKSKEGEEIKTRLIIGRVYDTPSGNLEPGNLFWNTWIPENTFWDNHKGPHLMCILPNNDQWNIDSRASNCGSPNDRNHRCWIRHGDPELGNIHVDKNGLTCTAGAGSIDMGGWHGFLHNGELKK